MSTLRSMPLLRHASLLSAVVVLAVGAASAHAALAQIAPSHDPSSSTAVSESSSSGAIADDSSSDGGALPSAPAASGGAQEEGNGNGGYHSHSLWSHLTYEGGGGFNAPGGDSPKDITWGGDFTLGAGYRFNQRLSALIEYQFIDDKLPGALIAQAGATGGNAHIWSLTIDPVFDLMPKKDNSVYLTGGGGFYRKVTNFTDPEPTQYCSYFYCGYGYANQVVGHYSSNQGGFNIGGGFQHRFGGIYGDSKVKAFAEVRYLDVLSPSVTTSANGLGITTVSSGTKVIPISLGVRF
jgi:hypothetical protein